MVDELLGGGGGGHMMPGMAPGGIDPSSGSTGSALKSVDRIRNVFPETWLWSIANVGFVSCSHKYNLEKLVICV